MDTSKMSKSALSRYHRYIRRYKSIAPKMEPEDAVAMPGGEIHKRIKIEKPDNGYEVDRRAAELYSGKADTEDRKVAKKSDESAEEKDHKVAKKSGENVEEKDHQIAKKSGESAEEKDRKVAKKSGENAEEKDRKVAKKFVENAEEKDRKVAKKFVENASEESQSIGKNCSENADVEDRKIVNGNVFHNGWAHKSDEEKVSQETIKSITDALSMQKLVSGIKVPEAMATLDSQALDNGYSRICDAGSESSEEELDIRRALPDVESSEEDCSFDESAATLYRRLKRKRRVAYPSDSSDDDDFPPKKIKTEPSERSSSPGFSVPERSASPEYDLPVKQKIPEKPIKQEKPDKLIKQEKPDKPIKQEKPEKPIKQEKPEKLDENEPGSSKRDSGDEKKSDSDDTESVDTMSNANSHSYEDEFAEDRTMSGFEEDDTDDETYTPDEYDDYDHWNRSNTSKNRSLFKDNSFEMDPAFLMPKVGDDGRRLGEKAQATLNREQILTVECLKELHGSLVARPVENEKATDPRGLKVALMPHQQHALAWLQWREKAKPPGGVLADEMGLGKTLTMIALVMASIARKNDGEDSENEEEWKTCARGQRHLGGTLVVVPASLLAQWEAEVKNRCKRDTITVEVYHGAKRETQPKRLAKNDIVITTYNIVCREYKMGSLLYKIRWRRVILDEAHVIRNYKSQPCQSVCALHTGKRWAVTGTPLHNKESDLYSLLRFLQCSPFDDYRLWRKWVDNRNDAGHQRLATVMKTLMLRRTKEELQAKGELPPLPDKSVQVIEVSLDTEERLIYDKVMLFSRTLFAQFLDQRAAKANKFNFVNGGYERLTWNYRGTTFTKAQTRLLSQHADVQAHEILVLLIRLRQICCHPSLIKAMLDRDDIELQGTDIELFSKTIKLDADSDDEGEDVFQVDERVTEHLLTTENPVFNPKRTSSKMRAVISKIEDILDQGDKLIVVSQWVSVLNILAKELDVLDGAAYRMFTGQVAVKDRQSILDDFNSDSVEPNILLLSLNAGGVGLNVVGANHMLIVDIHWNPQLESQAQDRIHRFGQTKVVTIYKYICTDTIEERIQALQNKKLELARQVLNSTGKIIGSKLTLDDIKSLFGV